MWLLVARLQANSKVLDASPSEVANSNGCSERVVSVTSLFPARVLGTHRQELYVRGLTTKKAPTDQNKCVLSPVLRYVVCSEVGGQGIAFSIHRPKNACGAIGKRFYPRVRARR